MFEVWYRRHLRPAIIARALEAIVGSERAEATTARIAPGEDLLADARIDIDLMETPGTRVGPDPDRFLADTVATTLPAAVAEVGRLLGPDRTRWSWGRLHVARAVHPVRALLTGVPDDQLVAGPAPRGGSGDTVGNTAYGPTFVQSAGSTFRIVVDLGDWDSSLAMNSPGQSGRLGDPHTMDLFEPWARGEAFPLAYTRERVDQVTEHLITLVPPPD